MLASGFEPKISWISRNLSFNFFKPQGSEVFFPFRFEVDCHSFLPNLKGGEYNYPKFLLKNNNNKEKKNNNYPYPPISLLIIFFLTFKLGLKFLVSKSLILASKIQIEIYF